MATQPTRQYGNTIVTDNGFVHQGDQDNSRNYRFDHVNTVKICVGSCVHKLQEVSPEHDIDFIPTEIHPSSASPILPNAGTNVSARGQITHFVNGRRTQGQRDSAAVDAILEALGNSTAKPAHVLNPNSVGWPPVTTTDLKLLHPLSKLAVPQHAWDRSPSDIASIRAQDHDCDADDTDFPRSHQSSNIDLSDKSVERVGMKNLMLNSTLDNAIQDLVAVFCAMMTVSAFGPTLNVDTTFVSYVKQLQKLSLISGLAVFMAARYYCLPMLGRALSELSGDCIIIQDAFCMDRKVPMTHLQHYKMVSAFLSVHLAGTTAEAFVNVEQYNLTLGKRDGPAIWQNDWSSKGFVKAGSRVVMSVYLKRSEAKCIDCGMTLGMSPDGQYICHPCGRFYANCAALRTLTKSTKHRSTKNLSPSPFSVPSGSRSRQPGDSQFKQTEQEEREDDYNLTGLRNVDFRIIQCCQDQKVKFDNTREAQHLFEACCGGDLGSVRMIVSQGVNVNSLSSKYRAYALQGAANEGHTEIARLLLDSGAPVNAHSGYYGSALQAAARRGHVSTMQLLLDRHADVNARGGRHGSPLDAALRMGHAGCVQLLLDHGATANPAHKDNSDVGEAIPTTGTQQSLTNADLMSSGNYNSLMRAAKHGQREEVKLLLNHGADVNASGQFGTALHEAVYYNHLDLVQLLLDHGADVNAAGPWGTAIQLIVSSQDHNQVRNLLLQSGAIEHMV